MKTSDYAGFDESVVAVLLSRSCQSIKYRLRKELLGEQPASPEMREIQARILEDPAVEDVIRSRQADGWLGRSFHGEGGIEARIRLLCEKGVERDNPVLADALVALERATERLELGIGKVGSMLDELGLGGTELIRAATFAHAGIERKRFVREQIRNALERFRAVTDVTSVEEVTEDYKGNLVFREGVKWPCIYDLRLLALTSRWRTRAGLRSLAASLERLTELSPIPEVHGRHGTQIIAPASYCMHDFVPDMQTMSRGQWAMWFHRMELLSRLGVTSAVPALSRQVDALLDMLGSADGFFTLPLGHDYFRKWGSYTGLMLERDWRSPKRRVNDLTFRSLLISRYARASGSLDLESPGLSRARSTGGLGAQPVDRGAAMTNPTSRLDEEGRAEKGSRLQIQIYVNRRVVELGHAVVTALPVLAEPELNLAWVSPLEGEGFREYQDEAFLRVLGLDEHVETLRGYWPRGGPVWDALARVDGPDGAVRGVILVEAKSHPDELRGSGCRATGESRRMIESALSRTRDWLGAKETPAWTGEFYQMANRLAHLHFFRETVGLPAWLLNVLFCDDKSHRSATRQEWTRALKEAKAKLALPESVSPHYADAFLQARRRDELLGGAVDVWGALSN